MPRSRWFTRSAIALFLCLFAAIPAAASELFVSDFNNDNVLRFNGDTGAFQDVYASGGGLNAARGMAFGADGNFYVASGFSAEVLRYNGATGAFIDDFVAAGSGGLNAGSDLLFRVPEPSALALLVIGMAALVLARRRRL
jgi:hypothetical protein